MSIKIIFIIVFIFILISLGSALFQMVKHKDKEHSEKMAKALTYRISLSLILFVLMFIAYATGMVKPEGIGANIQAIKQNKQLNSK